MKDGGGSCFIDGRIPGGSLRSSNMSGADETLPGFCTESRQGVNGLGYLDNDNTQVLAPMRQKKPSTCNVSVPFFRSFSHSCFCRDRAPELRNARRQTRGSPRRFRLTCDSLSLSTDTRMFVFAIGARATPVKTADIFVRVWSRIVGSSSRGQKEKGSWGAGQSRDIHFSRCEHRIPRQKIAPHWLRSKKKRGKNN